MITLLLPFIQAKDNKQNQEVCKMVLHSEEKSNKGGRKSCWCCDNGELTTVLKRWTNKPCGYMKKVYTRLYEESIGLPEPRNQGSQERLSKQ